MAIFKYRISGELTPAQAWDKFQKKYVTRKKASYRTISYELYPKRIPLPKYKDAESYAEELRKNPPKLGPYSTKKDYDQKSGPVGILQASSAASAKAEREKDGQAKNTKWKTYYFLGNEDYLRAPGGMHRIEKEEDQERKTRVKAATAKIDDYRKTIKDPAKKAAAIDRVLKEL